jgi:hypothetical protein
MHRWNPLSLCCCCCCCCCRDSINLNYLIKDLGVFNDSKIRFHNYVDYIFSQCIKFLSLVQTINDYIFSQCIKFLSLVQTINFSFSTCMLYFTVVQSWNIPLFFWNSITSACGRVVNTLYSYSGRFRVHISARRQATLKFFMCFQPVQESAGMVPYIRVQLLPSTSFPVHYS